MKSSHALLFLIRSAGLLVALALLAPALSAQAPQAGDQHSSAAEPDKVEIRASLERLDADIEQLAAKIDAIANPMLRDELKQTLTTLKARRNELNREFRKDRYDALAADVKAEKEKLGN